MIIELGHFSLVLALVVALAQTALPLWGAQINNARLMSMARPAALAQLLCILIAFAALLQAYVVCDFSVAAVAHNSNAQQPLIYRMAGLWGNHEGSLLLWVTILAIYGAAVAAFGDNLPTRLQARVLAIQALIALGFLAFMLFTSNPFLRLDPAPAIGAELNPILQDPGLAFHPPTLYLGYVGLSMAFSFAVAALIEGKVDAAWARWVRPWTLAAWTCLTAGIGGGSWWAYHTLGWGGWWFWDPVENASFMPWLVATALLHSAIVVEKRDALKGWTILLAIFAFAFSLIGTFLVRSGVITSVHSFASDPGRGVFILALLVLLHRRRAGALRLARAKPETRRPVRADQPRGRAADQQSAAGDGGSHGLPRHALSAVPRCDGGRKRLGGRALLLCDVRSHRGAAAGALGHRPLPQLEARRPTGRPAASQISFCRRHRFRRAGLVVASGRAIAGAAGRRPRRLDVFRGNRRIHRSRAAVFCRCRRAARSIAAGRMGHDARPCGVGDRRARHDGEWRLEAGRYPRAHARRERHDRRLQLSPRFRGPRARPELFRDPRAVYRQPGWRARRCPLPRKAILS